MGFYVRAEGILLSCNAPKYFLGVLASVVLFQAPTRISLCRMEHTFGRWGRRIAVWACSPSLSLSDAPDREENHNKIPHFLCPQQKKNLWSLVMTKSAGLKKKEEGE